MAQDLGKKLSFRYLFSSLAKGMGMLMLPAIRFVGRLFGRKTKTVETPQGLYQILGVFTLLLIAVILLIWWRSWWVLPILVLHTWAMLLFTKTEVFLRLNMQRALRIAMVLFQVAFLFALIFIAHHIALPIVMVFWGLAWLWSTIVFNDIRIYAWLLAQDRFDAYYWWNKRVSTRSWEPVIKILVERRHCQSLLDIVWQFMRAHRQPEWQYRYAPVMFEAWVKLRKYEILPDDQVLTHRQLPNKKTGLPPNDYLLGFACNFPTIAYLIREAQGRDAYHRLLVDFLDRLQIDLENYIQKPFKVNIENLPDPKFTDALDVFLAEQPAKIQDEALREKFSYCYGLFYLTGGIAKNM